MKVVQWERRALARMAMLASSLGISWACHAAGSTATTTTFTSNASTAYVGQAVTLTATVAPSSGLGVAPSGTITFKDGTTALTTCAGTLAAGKTTCTIGFSTSGVHSLTASYSGDSTYAASSGTVGETVNKNTASVAVVPSANPSPAGLALALVATVNGYSPTGTVQFKDNGTAIGSAVTLVSGQASISVMPTAQAGHTYLAAYSGDTGNVAASGQAIVNVTGANSTVAITASTNAGKPWSTSVTFTATVTGSSPTGSVTFRDGGTGMQTVMLSGGKAAYSTYFANGLHSVVASYGGDTSNSSSSSGAALVMISAAGTAQPAGAALQVNYEYDAQGNVTKVTDVNANANGTQTAYDSLSRATQITQPVPATGVARPTIGLGYDLQDQPASVTDPRNLVTSYATDGLGNTATQVSPDTGTTTRTFYDDGSLKTAQDARGRLATYTYDALGRVKSISYDSGAGTTFTYDEGTYGKGYLTTVTDESGSTHYVYDGLGHVLSKTQSTGPASKALALSYSWGTTGSANGKLQTVRYPSGASVAYGYDIAGRVNDVSVTGADGVVTKVLTGLEYTALGQPKSWAWGLGTTTYSRGYDSYGRLVRFPLGKVGGTGISAGFVRVLYYDALGHIATYAHYPTTLDQNFSYDGLDRLVASAMPSNSTSTYAYAYDATGNRTLTTINGTAYPSTVSATTNWYTSVSNAAGTASQSYDAAGHLTGDASGTYAYSARGRLSGSTIAGSSFSYLYNGFEQRVYKSGPSAVITTGTAYYAYDEAGHLVGEYDSTGKAVYETVYVGDLPVAALTQAAIGQTTVSYVYTDQLNTARMIVRPSDQAILWTWGSNDPFGQTSPNSNPSGLGAFTYNPRMPGQVADAESGWFDNWHRDYNPALGRYTESDPIGLAGGVNTYGYVLGQPTRLTDPKGQQVAQGVVIGIPIVIIGCYLSPACRDALKDLLTPLNDVPWMKLDPGYIPGQWPPKDPPDEKPEPWPKDPKNQCIRLYEICQRYNWKGSCGSCLQKCIAQQEWPFHECFGPKGCPQ